MVSYEGLGGVAEGALGDKDAELRASLGGVCNSMLGSPNSVL